MRTADDLTGRARIRDAALELFGSEGFARASVRAIAAKAGVSAALVTHHFGSKDALRKECDAYVVAAVRGGPKGADGFDDPAGLAAMLESAGPVRRYMARAFLDGTPEAGELFDEIVAATQVWLADGVEAGWVREAEDPRARAAMYVSWLLAPLVFGDHLARALDVADVHDMDATMRFSRTAIEMFSGGVFTDERVVNAWDAAEAARRNR